MNKFRGFSDPHHSAAQTCADPCPKRPQGSNVSRRRQRSTRRTRSEAAPTSRQRLCLLRRRPSSDRKSGARPGGPCRSVGGPVPGARRVSPASQSEPAGIPPTPLSRSEGGAGPFFLSPFQGEMQRGFAGDAQPRAGRPHVEPTDVYPRPPRGGGYSARGAREGESKEEANSERRPQSSRRTPCPRSGDAGRGW